MDKALVRRGARQVAALVAAAAVGWIAAVWQLHQTGVVHGLFARYYIAQGQTTLAVVGAFLVFDALWVAYRHWRPRLGDREGGGIDG